jgi:CRISPR-associated protein Csy2
MNGCPGFTHLLVLPHLRVQNANAVSSPLTHGFPSMTAFIGLMWALERKARSRGLVLEFNAVGVVSHGWQEQVTEGGFVKAFRLTRNPVDKDGSTAAIVEEGRIHLDLSLVLAIHAEHWDEVSQAADIAAVADLVSGMRVAGGIVLPQPPTGRNRPWAKAFTGSEEDKRAAFHEARTRLLPGSALVSRDDLLDKRLAELQAEDHAARRLDAWLSLSRINWRYDPGANDGKGAWQNDHKKGGGWIVPIPVLSIQPAAYAMPATPACRSASSKACIRSANGSARIDCNRRSNCSGTPTAGPMTAYIAAATTTAPPQTASG